MADSKEVVVINRTQAEVTVNTATLKKNGKLDKKPIEVTQNGASFEACDITLPGTPRHSFQPVRTTFKKADWEAIESSAAIKGMISTGQIEVH